MKMKKTIIAIVMILCVAGYFFINQASADETAQEQTQAKKCSFGEKPKRLNTNQKEIDQIPVEMLEKKLKKLKEEKGQTMQSTDAYAQKD